MPKLIPWYDDWEFMQIKTKTIAGLRELFKARRKAGYENNERLRDWIVLGRWYLDSCGNASRLTEGLSVEEANALNPVITWKEFWDNKPRTKHITSGLDSDLPTETTLCHLCKTPWSEVKELDDVFTQCIPGEMSRFWHKECWDTYKKSREQKYFYNIFKDAGFNNVGMAEVKNKYCSCELCRPWYDVVVPGGVIKIGWRKNVINIDWSGLRINNKPASFGSENVTQGLNYIHAWGKEKATEYLKLLRENIRDE